VSAPSSPEVNTPNGDPLAAFRRDDDPRLVDWLKVGAAEQARRTGRHVPQDDQLDALAWLHSNGGSLYVAAAAEDYATWVVENAVALGYTHIETTRSRHGRRTTTTRRITTRRARPGRYWFASVASTRPSKIMTSVTSRGRSREHRPASRRTSSSSSTSSSDPGASDSDDSEPSSAPRQCAAPWCARPVLGASQKRFCGTERCNEARAAERQRKHRSDDPAAVERARLEDARRAGYVGREAFAGPTEHALSFLWKFALADGPDPGELEAFLNRPACRCNGHHIDGGVVGCFKCGLEREAVTA